MGDVGMHAHNPGGAARPLPQPKFFENGKIREWT